MLERSTLQLLRFHFSLFLLPVYLFALSQVSIIHWRNAVLVFIILHLLVYPSSNGYNSYMDKDETPIGGLSKPLQPTKQLFYVSIIMDIGALLLAFSISIILMVGILFYILASRAYSYRGIRLKQYPVTGFFTVFIFQGAVIFFITYNSCQKISTFNIPVLPALTSSLLIGALYPLTQIYQHKEDKRDGVITISYWLGKRGSFIFSMILFLHAAIGMYFIFRTGHLNFFYLFLLSTLPVILFFLYWMIKVWRNSEAADFKHSFRMNVIATVCTIIFFSTLIIIKHFE